MVALLNPLPSAVLCYSTLYGITPCSARMHATRGSRVSELTVFQSRTSSSPSPREKIRKTAGGPPSVTQLPYSSFQRLAQELSKAGVVGGSCS